MSCWPASGGWRPVAGPSPAGSVELAEPTAEGMRTLHRQAQHGRRVRLLGLLLGVAGVIASVVLFAEASVFLWVPILVLGLLAGVLLAEATRPRPRWKLAVPARRPRRSEQISGWLVWTMRVAVAAQVALAASLWRADELSDGVAWAALVAPLAAWLLAEIALLRALLRPMPAEGADVPVDEALRTWTAHLVTAAATVLALLPLGTLLLRAGIDPDRVTEGFDFLPVALVAGGLLRARRGPRGRRVPADLAASGAVQRPGPGGLTPGVACPGSTMITLWPSSPRRSVAFSLLSQRPHPARL